MKTLYPPYPPWLRWFPAQDSLATFGTESAQLETAAEERAGQKIHVVFLFQIGIMIPCLI